MLRRSRFCTWIAAALVVGCISGPKPEIDQADAHRELGELYLQRGELELSIREFRTALKFWSGDASTHFSIGEAYRRKKEYELAETHLRRSLAIEPELLDARLNLGVLYLQQERWADAIRENQLLLKEPTFLNPARALVNVGWAYYKSDDLEEAESSFRQAVAANRSSFPAHLNLGIVLYDRNEPVEAIREFEKVIELLEGRPPQLYAPAEAETRFRMAMAHIRLGQRGRALEQLRAAAQEGNETEWGRKSEEYLAVLE